MMGNKKTYVKKIFIKNYLGITNINCKLFQDVNILIGINGGGKSTFLQSIAAALNSDFNSTPNKLSDFIEIELSTTEKFIVDKDSPRRGQLFESVFIDFSEFQFVAESTIKKIGDSEILSTLDFLLHKAIKRRNELLSESFSEGPEAISSLNNLNRKLFACIEKIFNDSNKELKNQTPFSFLHRPTGNEISCYQLSTGEKQMLIILLTVFNTRQRPCLLILDNPGVYLHLEWESNLINIIKELNPNCQLLISTHSPGIFCDGWNDKIIFMEDILS